MAFERDKIRGAVRTDFILSAEIIAITLGTVATASFLNQVLVLSGIALLAIFPSRMLPGYLPGEIPADGKSPKLAPASRKAS